MNILRRIFRTFQPKPDIQVIDLRYKIDDKYIDNFRTTYESIEVIKDEMKQKQKQKGVKVSIRLCSIVRFNSGNDQSALTVDEAIEKGNTFIYQEISKGTCVDAAIVLLNAGVFIYSAEVV